MTTDLRIDPELRSLIPPLSAEERAILSENIQHHGVRDALVVWDEENVLLDGHNRYEIAQRYGLPYRVERMSFPDRESACDWMDANQLGRRNLSPDAASLLRGRRHERLKKSAAEAANARWQAPPKVVDASLRDAPRYAHAKVADAWRGASDSVQHHASATMAGASLADRLANQHGVSPRTIARDGAFARAVDTLATAVPDLPARVMAGDIPSRRAVEEAAQHVQEAAKRGAMGAELEQAKEEAAAKLARPHVANNSGNNEWYTPPEYIESSRALMGGIDCDPASSEVANRTVRADTFHTVDDDGRTLPWGRRVWLNPPYGQPLCGEFAEQLAARVEAGEVEQAVVLVNNATETAWFQRLAGACSALCLPRGRIRFRTPEETVANTPLQGQVVLYAGPRPDEFAVAFGKFGAVARFDR